MVVTLLWLFAAMAALLQAVAASPLLGKTPGAGVGGANANADKNPSLIDVSSTSYGGSDGNGVGLGLGGSAQLCALGDLLCLGDAGGIAAGALGAQAIGAGKATSKDGQQGALGYAGTSGKGVGGVGAAEGGNLCLAGNCFGLGGALALGDASAGALGGSLPAASSTVKTLTTRTSSGGAGAVTPASLLRAVTATSSVSSQPVGGGVRRLPTT
ncbi:unnamed protein product [Parajaminaea phylloscopi]